MTIYSNRFTMHLRPIIVAAAFIVAGSRLAAQEVQIEVVELANGKPIVGASVSLVDDHGVSLFGGFSDQGGHLVLRAPSSGKYVVRADKAGYDTWASVVLHVTGTPIRVRAGMLPTRIPTSVAVRSDAACQLLTQPGTAAGDLWVDIKKALTASAVTEARGLVPLDVELYERALDRDMHVVSERTEQRLRIGRRPAIGVSWDQVDSARRGAVAGGDVYRAPDAATLVSDQFVTAHCFAPIRGYGPETGLSGLEFRPAKVGSLPELTGIFWVDPKSSALRSVNFDYVNLPIPLRVARTSGRLEFQQLSGGQWIVPRWYIRMPRVAQMTSTETGSPAVAHDTLIGYQEVGGTSRPAGTPAPAPTGVAAEFAAQAASAQSSSAGNLPDSEGVSAPKSVISGVVYDSTAGGPLKDVQVSTGGGRFKAVTGPGGHYEIVFDGPISDTIVFDHPRLRLFRLVDRRQTVSVQSGGRTQANLVVPSYGTLRKKLCGPNGTGTDSQGIVAGYVRDAAGNPIRGAHVWAMWPLLWIEQNGRLVSTNQQRVVETDTGSDGSYLLCGLTPGAQITAKVGMAGRGTVEEKLALPASMVLEHNFTSN